MWYIVLRNVFVFSVWKDNRRQQYSNCRLEGRKKNNDIRLFGAKTFDDPGINPANHSDFIVDLNALADTVANIFSIFRFVRKRGIWLFEGTLFFKVHEFKISLI